MAIVEVKVMESEARKPDTIVCEGRNTESQILKAMNLIIEKYFDTLYEITWRDGYLVIERVKK